jgi:D-glycero-alpha-D-manno-heptose-7-phosphate kinase
MILTKTPFRISFVGGGSDLPSFYRSEAGAVLSTTIDKYMYIAVNRNFENRIKINYSLTEEVTCAGEVRHPLVREALKLLDINGGVDISSLADIPSKGSGLGSSSSYTVGLLSALSIYLNHRLKPDDLARLACEIEIDRLGEPIGKQDQYAAAFGGLNVYKFLPDDSVEVEAVTCNSSRLSQIQENLVMFYTGITRKASDILMEQSESSNTDKSKKALKRMVELVKILKKELELGCVDNIGPILNENWELKKLLASKVSDPMIDSWYSLAMMNGATGGKLLGAGGGGFLLFYTPDFQRERLVKAMAPLKQVEFSFCNHGSEVAYSDIVVSGE